MHQLFAEERGTKKVDENGNWISNKTQIGKLLVSHFQNILALQDQGHPIQPRPHTKHLFEPIITEDINNRLCKKLSEDEIKTNLFNICILKAPGPKEFPNLLYQQSWYKVKEDLIHHSPMA